MSGKTLKKKIKGKLGLQVPSTLQVPAELASSKLVLHLHARSLLEFQDKGRL